MLSKAVGTLNKINELKGKFKSDEFISEIKYDGERT